MFEFSNELEELGKTVIEKYDEFSHLRHAGPRIVYQYSDRKKLTNGKAILADTTKVSEKMKPASRYTDFVITFYRPSVENMTPEQMEILMRHEMKHVGWDEGNAYIVPHDVEDFSDIIKEHGTEWWFN